MTSKEYNKCVDEYADGLYRFALKIVKETEIAKDVVQDAFEKLWINKEKIDATKVKSYIFTVAYHSMIDKIRKYKRIEEFTSNNFEDGIDMNQYSDLNELLHKIAEKLPDVQKSVLFLRDYEGYSYEEIEEITGLGLSQVKVYIHRARLYMKQQIGSIDAVI